MTVVAFQVYGGNDRLSDKWSWYCWVSMRTNETLLLPHTMYKNQFHRPFSGVREGKFIINLYWYYGKPKKWWRALMDLGGETDSLNRGWKTMAHRINLASDLYL